MIPFLYNLQAGKAVSRAGKKDGYSWVVFWADGRVLSLDQELCSLTIPSLLCVQGTPQ